MAAYGEVFMATVRRRRRLNRPRLCELRVETTTNRVARAVTDGGRLAHRCMVAGRYPAAGRRLPLVLSLGRGAELFACLTGDSD